MKKVLFSLLLAGIISSAAMAQTTQNAIVVGAHVLKPGTTPTVVKVFLLNPTDVAGVQIRLLYDPNVVEAVDPTGTDFEGTENAGTVITGSTAIVNYEPAAAPDANGMKGINIAIAAVKGSTKSGQLIQVEFRPKAGAAALSSSAITVDPTPGTFLFSDSKSQEVAATVKSGSLIIGGSGTTAGWDQTIPQGISGSASTDGTTVWVVGDDSILHAYNVADGLATAGFTAPNVGGLVLGRPVAREGSAYIATSNGKVHSINPATGAVNWTRDLSAGDATFTIRSTPAVANGFVYVTDGNDVLHALSIATTDGTADKTAQISTGATANTQGFSSPAAFGPAASTTVWVGGADNAVHQYTGGDLTPQKTVATGGRVQSSPFITPSGTGYVGSEDGKVYVFDSGTGDTLGSYDTTGPVQNSPFGVGANQAIVVNSSGQLHSVTGGAAPAGSNLLQFKDATNANNAAFGFSQSPIVLASGVWVGDVNGVLHNATLAGGAEKKIVIGSNPITSLSAPNGTTIVLSSQDGSVVALPTQ